MDFHQLGMCIDIVKIWFGIANRLILSNFGGVASARDTIMIGFYSLTFFYPLCFFSN